METMTHGGKGGQNANRSQTKVRWTHLESGAQGECGEGKSQEHNKKVAWERMANSQRFKDWHKAECARRLGQANQLEEIVNELMLDKNLKIEYY